jgi:hypothetical protein
METTLYRLLTLVDNYSLYVMTLRNNLTLLIQSCALNDGQNTAKSYRTHSSTARRKSPTSYKQRLFRRSREGGNPVAPFWIPAFAGTTIIWWHRFPWVARIRNQGKTSAVLYWLPQSTEERKHISLLSLSLPSVISLFFISMLYLPALSPQKDTAAKPA